MSIECVCVFVRFSNNQTSYSMEPSCEKADVCYNSLKISASYSINLKRGREKNGNIETLHGTKLFGNIQRSKIYEF